MARIRTVKPAFFTSDDICSLSMAARLLYIGTWCEADREGRMEWSPRSLKRRYLPDDDVSIEKVCAELTNAGLVVLYGEGLAYIPTFGKHQHINPRESESKVDAPDFYACSTRSARMIHASMTGDVPDSDAQGGRKGKEGKERKDEGMRSGAPESNGENLTGDAGRQGAAKQSPAKCNKLSEDFGIRELVAEGVNRQHAEDWLKVRKAKRMPLTRSAWDSMVAEADKFSITPAEAVRIAAERGWGGFMATYAKNAGIEPCGTSEAKVPEWFRTPEVTL